MGSVMNLKVDEYYHLNDFEKAQKLVVRLPKKAYHIAWSNKTFVTLTSHLQETLYLSKKVFYSTLSIALKTTLTNEVIIYESLNVLAKLKTVVEKFAKIWIDKDDAVKLLKKDWIRIPLRIDWESKITNKSKIYSLGIKNRVIVDEVFDKLQLQDRLEFTKQSILFCFPMFVIYKILTDDINHERPVVDIKRLNQVFIRDAYSLPPQAEIISLIADCPYVTYVNNASFFYQWRVYSSNRYKQTIVTHRGQKTFNVPLMSYCNSPAYVQRQTNRLLRPFKSFAKKYVNDIVIFSKTLAKHISHLRQVFTLFQRVRVTLKPFKSFLSYPNVQLLKQRVNSFKLFISSKRLTTISKLKFSHTLAALETYLNMTGYLRNYIV